MRKDHPGRPALADRVVRLSVQETYRTFPGWLCSALEMQTACTTLLYFDYLSWTEASVGSEREDLISITTHSFSDCCLSAIIYNQTFVMGIIWLDRMPELLSHTDFPEQTPHLNMTCELDYIFSLAVYVWRYPAPMSTAGFIARLTC